MFGANSRSNHRGSASSRPTLNPDCKYAHGDPRGAGNLDNYTFMAFHVRTYWSPLKMFKTLPR